MWTYNYTTELYHYGVPGMKWGKRKAVYTAQAEAYRNAAGNTKNQVKAAKLNVKADKAEKRAQSLDTKVGRAAYRARKGAKIAAGLLAAGLGAKLIHDIGFGKGRTAGHEEGIKEGIKKGMTEVRKAYKIHTGRDLAGSKKYWRNGIEDYVDAARIKSDYGRPKYRRRARNTGFGFL